MRKSEYSYMKLFKYRRNDVGFILTIMTQFLKVSVIVFYDNLLINEFKFLQVCFTNCAEKSHGSLPNFGCRQTHHMINQSQCCGGAVFNNKLCCLVVTMSHSNVRHHPLVSQDDSPFGSPSNSPTRTPRASPAPHDFDISFFRDPPDSTFSLMEVPPTNWTSGSGGGSRGNSTTDIRDPLYGSRKVFNCLTHFLQYDPRVDHA